MESHFNKIPTLVVADAGATKTEWWVMGPGFSQPVILLTDGINAATGDSEVIRKSVIDFKRGLERHIINPQDFSLEIFFYGAGCISDRETEKITGIFKKVFDPQDLKIKVFSDLDGAAVALYGDKSGIACILGTGSASCYYNGKPDGHITGNIPSLGFILGDEGSGSFMGRRLINSYFKNDISPELKGKLENFSDMSLKSVIEKVYHNPSAPKFLASFVPFIKEHEKEEQISAIIHESLKLFFEKNVLKYNHVPRSSVRFVGGVACAFRDRIIEIADSYGLVADKFIQKPIEELGEYYKKLYGFH